MRTIIGIDVGTTHIKSLLFSEQGRVIRQEKQKTPLSDDGKGSVYRPEEIWKTVESQLRCLLQYGGGRVMGISITGMAEAGLIVNRSTGREESAILPWFDGRTQKLAQELDPEREKEIFARTGLRNSFKYGIYKFLWLLSGTGVEKKDAVWLSMCDFIAWKLTGRFVTEPGFAARTYVYDIRKKDWDEGRIREYGLEPENFPEVVPSGSTVGFWRTEEGEIPVAIAGHDHICAAFGLLYHDESGICDSAGTSETYVGRLGEDAAFSRETGMLYGPFVDGGYFFMANVPSSGHSVEWFRTRLQAGGLPYETMNAQLEKLDKGPTGILYYPYLTGMGSPWYEASMRGTIFGIREETDGFTVLKGIMEGIQYQSAWLLDILQRKHGLEAERIFCAGGSVNNRVLMQIKSDVLDKTVIAPEMPEATLVGAAALFLKKNVGEEKAGQFTGAAFSKREVYAPDRERSGEYRRIWKERYLPMTEILRDFYHDGGKENG